jgi:hypothetical protein
LRARSLQFSLSALADLISDDLVSLRGPVLVDQERCRCAAPLARRRRALRLGRPPGTARLDQAAAADQSGSFPTPDDASYRAGVISRMLTVMFRRQRPDGRIRRSYATTSNVVPGPFAEYPNRDPMAAAEHAQAYEEQREHLQARLLERGQADELFIAKLFAVQRRDGGAHTYTTWTEGVKTLLPPADVVLLVEWPAQPDAKPVMTWVRWDVTAQVCADDCWKIMPDFNPPRLLTVGWPTPGQLESLKIRKLPR